MAMRRSRIEGAGIRQRGTWVRLVVACALVAACTGGSSTPEPSPTPTPSATPSPTPPPTTEELAAVDWLDTSWGEVVAMGHHDGTSTVEQAVAAWQVAFGPLPDAPAPLPQDISAPADGTMALELMAQHLDELTPDQLAVITGWEYWDVTGRDERDAPSPVPSDADDPSPSPTAAGDPSDTAPPGMPTDATTPVRAPSSHQHLALPVALAAEDDFATPQEQTTPDGSLPPARLDRGITVEEASYWRDLALQYWGTIQSRAGEGLPRLDSVISFEFMIPNPAFNTGAWTRPYVRSGEPVCQIVFWNARVKPEPTQRSAVAHELFHCATWIWADSTEQHDSLPWWVREGLTSWVGEELGGTSTYSPGWWGRYLCNACDGAWSLRRADYEAIGWWSFLEDRGADILPALTDLVRSDGPNGAWDNAIGLLPDDAARSAMASAATRRLDGAAWTMGGTGAISGARHVPERGTLAAGSVVTYHARAMEQRAIFLREPVGASPLLVEVEAVGWGTARWTGGEDVVAAGGTTTRTWCVGSCTCADGTDLAPGVERSPPATSGLLLAPAGDVDSESTMTVDVRPTDETCPEDPGGGTAQGPSGPTGRSHGDPHLTSFDGYGLDFQAVGEFVLVDAGDLQVQVRFAPVEAPLPMSRNTAVAVRVDDRVVEYGLGGIVLDGVGVAEVDTTTDDGTVLSANRSQGLLVGLPDGTTVAMNPSLTVVVQLGPDRVSDGVAGLLGDADGDRRNDIVLRSGELLAPPGQHPGDDALYGDWADSWRITDATSDFTYAPGESTATHTDRTFPGSDTRLSDLLERARQAAEERCRDAGITAPDLLQDCMLDVGVTGDEAWAEAGAAAGVLWLAALFGELQLARPAPPANELADALSAAAAQCDLAAVTDLLGRGAPPNGVEDPGRDDPQVPLVVAVTVAGTDCVDVVQALVDAGADPARFRHGPDQRLASVHLASDPSVLDILLSTGVDPNLLAPTNVTPLNVMLQRARGQDAGPVGPLVELLLAAGADPSPDTGQVPLIQAAEIPDLQATEALLAAGADPTDAYADGFAALHAAARTATEPDEVGILDALVAAGADPDAPEDFGFTPLHNAVLRVNVAAIERLMALGADPCLRDSDGRLPVDLVVSDEVAAVLPDCG